MKTLAQLCDDGMVQAKIEKKSIILLFFTFLFEKKRRNCRKIAHTHYSTKQYYDDKIF